MKKQRASAFTLVEMAIVLIILAVMIVGVLRGNTLATAFRLSSARNQTESSNVASIKGLSAWLETTSESSFLEAVEEGIEINTATGYSWNDINPQSAANQRVNALSATGPTYRSRCINNLPCLEFNNTDQFLDTTTSIGVSPQISIFVVFSSAVVPGSGNIDSLISVNGLDHTAANNSFQLNIDNNVVSYEFFDSSDDSSTQVQTAAISAGTNYILDVIDDGTFVQTISISGGGTMTRVDNDLDDDITTSPIPSRLKNLAVGLNVGSWDNGTTRARFFNGRIAEIIIFNRALKIEERNSVEDYLSQKWGITI